MKYISTRGPGQPIDFTTALMTGLAPDGGLYVPEKFDALPAIKPGSSYLETAQTVLGHFTAGSIDPATLRSILQATYAPRADGFQTPDVTPMVRLDDTLSVLELFHGPTLAFKDVALQLLGQLFDHELKKSGQRITILGATSGDTGSAAIEGCRHAAGAEIFILYPHGRTSDVQRRQMTTIGARNVHAIAIEGDFDNCQAIVKSLMNDAAFKSGHNLSAVNSINWARLAAQVVYYIQAAYAAGTTVNFVVPTGNFGNVYAAYVARKMGAPIGKLVVASNRNDILTRFLNSGTMKAGTVEPSLSPSMDIQVSSNFERLLFDMLGRDPNVVKTCMADFTKSGEFSVPQMALDDAKNIFMGVRCDDQQTLAAITKAHRDYGYILDPHTAVGYHAYETVKHELEGQTIMLACAHPAKFPDAVERATGQYPALPAMLADLHDRPEHFTVLPASADSVRSFIEKH